MKILMIFLITMTSVFATDLGKNLVNITLSFKQTLYSEGTPPISYYGTLIATNTNKAKWVYDKPIKKEMYINDDMVWIYEIDLNQATLLKTKGGLNFISILQNAKQKSAQIYEANIDNTLYTLSVDKNNAPQKLEFGDELGNKTIIEFSKITTNTKINDAIFKFTPSKDVDIIAHGN